jgi:hypothetical protein
MPRRFQQLIVGIQRAGLGPDPLRLVLLSQLPQDFAQVRRNVAIVIIRIRRFQKRQRIGRAPLAEVHPAQAVQNRGIFGGRRMRTLDQLARPREVFSMIGRALTTRVNSRKASVTNPCSS